ncbi:hypothetical protein [Paracoccus sediminilitoris]|nr:hypothetical protein [Paracoccus sediminilitoris]
MSKSSVRGNWLKQDGPRIMTEPVDRVGVAGLRYGRAGEKLLASTSSSG